VTAFKLQGIVAAPVLPMLPDYSIDWASLRSYIGWIARQKPTAIAMNMDASEGPSLDPDEQLEVLRVCKDAIGGAVPLVSGLIAGSTAAAVRWGNELHRAGAEGLAVFPPFPTFLGNPVPSEMIYAYHKAIADGVGLPLIAFQFPKAWGPDFPPETLARLAAIPQIIGLKEASFDTTKTVETIATARTLPRKLGIMTGSDTFICEAMVMGCDGALIGFAGTATAELIDMHRRVQAKDFAGAWVRTRVRSCASWRRRRDCSANVRMRGARAPASKPQRDERSAQARGREVTREEPEHLVYESANVTNRQCRRRMLALHGST
jgi:4-hydroxy-tetrahydrodipicolinate synthase